MGLSSQPHTKAATAKDVAAVLVKAKPTNGGKDFIACCPVHDDHTPSLSISDGNDGKVLLHCYAGCDYDAVADAIENHGVRLRPKPRSNPPSRSKKTKKHSQAATDYLYPDENGEVRYRVRRSYKDGKKNFSQARKNGSRWVPNMNGVERLPYNLPAVLTAEDVVIVEGEKDVDNLTKIGVVATCNSGGAGKWQPELNKRFEGKRVYIVPDNDEPGKKHARDVAEMLADFALKVSIVDMCRDMPMKADISDWLEKQKPVDHQAFFEAVFEAPLLDEEVPPPDGAAFVPTTNQPQITTGADFVADFVAPDYIVDDIIQRGRLLTATALTGHGKTAVAIYLMFCFAHGKPFGGREVEQGKVLLLAGENPDDVRARILVCSDVYNLAINENLFFLPGIINIEERFGEIGRKVEEIGDLTAVIVDTAAAYFMGTEENSNVEMIHYAHVLRMLSELPGKPAVIVPCHPVKNAAKDNLLPRGGGAFLNEVDGNLTLWSDDNGKTTQLHWQGKLRGPGFEPLDFELKTETSDSVRDTKSRLIPSVAAHPITEEKAQELTNSARSDENQLMDIMDIAPNASQADWCLRLGWLLTSGEPHKSKLHRTMKRLHQDRMVRNRRGKWSLTSEGKKEVNSVD
ncbi:MAG: AAA family ATPase [Rhodospirillales bacterium]|nr:AAA family ATPase [Rhodospirillales bacterium]